MQQRVHPPRPLLIPGVFDFYPFGDAWKSKTETALERAKKACGYELDPSKEALAIAEWVKLFGDFYTGRI